MKNLAQCRRRFFSVGEGDSASSGFSLIELVVVLLLVGIVGLVAVERVNVATSVRSRLAANELMVNLRHIRNTAMQRERTMRVSFDLASNSYSVAVYDSTAPGNFAPAVNPADRKDWNVSISRRFPGVSLASVDINGGAILFFNGTNGAPAGAGGSGLTTNGLVVFNTGVMVFVVPGTGYVVVE